MTIDLRVLILGALYAALACAAAGGIIGYRLASTRRSTPRTPVDLTHAPIGMIEFDKTGNILWRNDEARRALALTVVNVEAARSLEAMLRDDVRAALAKPESGAAIIKSAAFGDDCFAKWWVFAQPPGAVAFIQDVTAQHKAELGAQRLIGALSHELRTPLATMLSHAQIARSSDFTADTRDSSLALIQAEARRAGHLIEELTLLSTLETSLFQGQPVDIVRLAEQIVGQMLPRAEAARITIQLSSDARVPRVFGEGDNLRRVFLNLLDNAIKYCRAGDSVTVSIRTDGSRVTCEVADTGPGIRAEDLARVKQRLFRARTDVDGSGLGLALAEEIVQRHSGMLEITSGVRDGRTGATFRFTLPAIR